MVHINTKVVAASSHGAVNRKFFKDGAVIFFSIPLQQPRRLQRTEKNEFQEGCPNRADERKEEDEVAAS